MNSGYEQQLEMEIGRALQGQPDLAAPRGFAARTLRAIERPSPALIRPWSQWPRPARTVFLITSLAAVALAVMGWRVMEPGLVAAACRSLAPAASGLRCLWDVLGAFLGVLGPVLQHLGWRLPACIIAALGALAVCAGFGTIFVRLALPRPVRNQL